MFNVSFFSAISNSMKYLKKPLGYIALKRLRFTSNLIYHYNFLLIYYY